MENSEQPLLSTRDEDQTPGQPHNPILANTSLFSSHNANYGKDIDPINGVGDFFREFFVESKKLWRLAGPAIFSSLCPYSLGAVTQVFAGHLSALDLAAFAIENSVIGGFSSGILVVLAAESLLNLTLLNYLFFTRSIC